MTEFFYLNMLHFQTHNWKTFAMRLSGVFLLFFFAPVDSYNKSSWCDSGHAFFSRNIPT